MLTAYGIPLISVNNGNYNGQDHLKLKHIWTGYELDDTYLNATLENIFYLWDKKTFLETRVGDKDKSISYDYERKEERKKGKK